MSRHSHEFISLKGWAQNRGLFEHKFRIVRIRQFWRFQRDWTRKICGISWVCKKTICNENSGAQLTSNSNSVEFFTQNSQNSFTKLYMDIFIKDWYSLVQGHKNNVPPKIYEVPPPGTLPLPLLSIMEYKQF